MQKHILNTYVLSFVLVSLVCAVPVSAHTHVVQRASTHVMTEAEMVRVIDLLEQVVLLLAELKKVQQSTLVVTFPSTDTHKHTVIKPVEEVVATTTVASSTPPIEEVSDLVIEVETHHGRTHVHYRPKNAAEDMFFIDTPITDEEGILQELQKRYSTDREVMRRALVYFQ